LLLQNRIGRLLWRDIGLTTAKTLIATLAMSIVCEAMFMIPAAPDSGSGRLIRFLAPLLAGIVTFLATTRVVNLPEPWMLLGGRKAVIDAESGGTE
jgi:hypothetical protein